MMWVLRYDARPPTINGQRTKHFQVNAASTREWRDAFALLARAQKVPNLTAIRVTAQPVRPNRRAMPDVGACMPAVKAAIDGLVDALVIPDDTPTHLWALTFLPARIQSGVDALELTVEEAS